MNKKKIISYVGLGFLTLLSGGLIAGNIVCFQVLGVDFISHALAGTGATSGNEEASLLGESLVRKITEESTVLLKNENAALPLNLKNEAKVNVFGYTSNDKGWVFTGVGSGSCKPDPAKRIGFLQGLKNAGFQYNESLASAYDQALPTSDPWLSMNQNGKILQPDNSFYSTDRMKQCQEFSPIALIVLSRDSGENAGEIPSVSTDYLSGEVDQSRSYLQLSKKEEFMLNQVKENFEKVIVILNTTNNLQCDFLRDAKIDAALYCGPTGLSGAESVANLLAGGKNATTNAASGGNGSRVQLSPSGHLADTYSADYTLDPAYANHAVRNKSATGGNIVYQEGLYIGYRWYETAEEMGFFSGMEKGYDSAVVYPFGYGLSYTSFSWSLVRSSLPDSSELKETSELTYEVQVSNTGSYPGKDVVELYCKAPYLTGGIEKSAITLVAFAKTSTLQPGESQTLTLSTKPYDFASYDCYDQNKNAHTGYELDPGVYSLELRSDAHHRKNMDKGVFTYSLGQGINYDKDPLTQHDVLNRFTGTDAPAGVALDGSTIGINETYLSRADFYKTFKDRPSSLPNDTAKLLQARLYATSANDTDIMPTFDEKNGLSLTHKADGSLPSASDLSHPSSLVYDNALVDELLKDPQSPKWDQLLNQLSKADARALVEKSGFGSPELSSIGKPRTLDFDGPSGFNENTQKIAEDKSAWTSYPSEEVIACSFDVALANELGQSMAFEASKSGINGWYAPGVNLHRSNYNGRNYEYYSEDPLISGKMAAATISGAKSGGLYCYLKHFALSEEGDNAKGVDTWISEQSFRELYLKPFEIAVKSGANALMSAFNRIGPIWAGANFDLLTEILRGEWGFQGSVITDWSSGDEIMNAVSGVKAGNDMWLNPLQNNGTPLHEDDATEMTCAKMAVRHNVYTYLSTYQSVRDFDPTNNPYKVSAGIKGPTSVTSWWIPTLIGIDVIFFGATVADALYLFVPWSRLRKKRPDPRS